MIPVSEIFTSIDGEINPFGHGVSIFLRVHKCNLSCNWCDTVVKEYKMMEINEIVEHIKSYGNIKKITITGGEPLLYKEEISKLIFKLHGENILKISIETNGTQSLFKYRGVSHIVDYKLPSSGCEHAMDLNIYETFSNALDYVKFCIMDKHDYKRACEVALKLQTDYEIYGSRIAFSPIFEANNSSIKKDLAKWMIEDQLPYKYNLQIHKIIGLR
ncbi:MAG: 7-carboxy-7-deazaguanine synthase QueE [Bacteroidota bacterium]